MTSLVHRIHARGRAAHPTVDLAIDELARRLTPHLAAAEAPDDLHAEDLYVACAAAAGIEDAVVVIDRRHLSKIPVFLAKRRLSPEVLDELIQRARERLFVAAPGAAPKIAEYAGRGPLDAWLRVLVVRLDATRRRREHPEDELDEATQAELTASTPEQLLARERVATAWRQSLTEAFAALDDEQKALFRLQFGKGMSLDAIAIVLDVHRATVARKIAAARTQLWTDLTRCLQSRLGGRPEEVEALLGEWRSKLTVSLSGLLKSD